MKKRSKKYVEALSKLEKGKVYTKEEAAKLVKETSVTSFDGSVEVAVRLNLDTKKADQQLRGAVALPKGTGKEVRVLVLTKGPKAAEAREAGAEYVGEVDLIDKIANENWFEFDTIIASPEMMPLLGKLGKVLGPKGLMPNPKTGTVTMDVTKAVNEIKAGKVEYRAEKAGVVHTPIGKVSFSTEDLVENFNAVQDALAKAKPAAAKGTYFKSVAVTTTMGPGVRVNTAEFK